MYISLKIEKIFSLKDIKKITYYQIQFFRKYRAKQGRDKQAILTIVFTKYNYKLSDLSDNHYIFHNFQITFILIFF